jgi:L-cysteine desulfidase
VSLPLARQLYTFDLMKIALSATAPADLKIAVENILISRLNAVTVGERLTLARRASGRVAAAMLIGSASDVKVIAHENTDAKGAARDTRILHTALDNPRLTEVLVINSVLHPAASADLVQALSVHSKWSIRREVRSALLRTKHLSLAKALEFSQEIPDELMRDILANSNLTTNIKQQLLHQKSL